MTPRQQIIVDLLGDGPRTMRELATACGYEAGARGSNYVSLTLGRLAGRGYGFHNYNPRGSCRGGYYALMKRPHGEGSPLREDTCQVCHARLNRWNMDGICWPCQRSGLDAELEMLAPPTLFPVSVAS